MLLLFTDIHNLLPTETVQVTCGNHRPAISWIMFQPLNYPSLQDHMLPSLLISLISVGDIPAGIGPHQPNPQPPSGQPVDHKHTMLDHSPAHHPVNYYQSTSAGDTSLKRVSTGDIKRGPGEVQHVAIAESDIIGWTEDGRLLVQMQAPAGPGPGPGTRAVGNVHNPARRASTGTPH